ncbi:MAG: 2,3-diphosphoglycerate-dependent phosphoglycerate mutase [Acholeplasmataceae bacterium]
MSQLILIRHGQSLWNLENKFTGWTDIELSDQGVKEAITAGKNLYQTGIDIDIAFSSVLKRANDTLTYILKEMHKKNVPIHKSWRLNERHYGALQGLNKKETMIKFGEEQVQTWRRSFDTLPPLLDENDPRNPKFDSLYRGIKNLPLGESLESCQQRVLPYWYSDIYPELKKGNNVLIVAHGNSLRSLIMFLENLSKKEVLKLELPTGLPIIYNFDNQMHVISKKIIES